MKKIKVVLSVIIHILILSSASYAIGFDIDYNEIFESHRMVRMIIDVEAGFIVQANQAAEDYYGYTRDELLKMKITDINTLHHEDTRKELKAAEEGERNYFIFEHKLANGDVRDVEIYSYMFNREGKEYLYSMVIDITHKMELNRSLEKSRRLIFTLFGLILILLLLGVIILYFSKEKYKKIANYDHLTGAYSRLYLDEWKVKCERPNEIDESNMSIIMIDLKDFKQINDTYGHIIGDKVLRKTTNTIKECIREDDFVVRYGGDEFLLILKNTTEEQAEIVMNRMDNKLKNNEEFNFSIKISYGIYEAISGSDIFESIKYADEEMYTMKNLNRNSEVLST